MFLTHSCTEDGATVCEKPEAFSHRRRRSNAEPQEEAMSLIDWILATFTDAQNQDEGGSLMLPGG